MAGNFYIIQHEGNTVARLNKHICNSLRPLSTLDLEIEAYIREDDFTAETSSRPSSGTVALELIVYGPKDVAQRIATILYEAHLYLQLPSMIDGRLYLNPQILKLEGFTARAGGIQDSEQMEIQVATRSTPLDTTSLDEPSIRVSREIDVDYILDSLAHNNVLHEVRTDKNCIRSELLP